MTAHALYKAEVVNGVLCIVDLDEPGHMSVTNDAEAIIASLYSRGVLPPGRRVIYRDSIGIWDEMLVDDRGRFTGFSPLRAHSLVDALALVRHTKGQT